MLLPILLVPSMVIVNVMNLGISMPGRFFALLWIYVCHLVMDVSALSPDEGHGT